MKCEACEESAFSIISYLRKTSRGEERIYRPLCQKHGQQIWDALAVPLKDTAIIFEPSSVEAAE